MKTTNFFSRGTPAVKNRGVHLDLKGLPPKFDRLIQIADLCAFLRVNFLLFEMEDMFPWRRYPVLRSRHAYSKAQMERFAGHCRSLGMRVIPLVQSYGHLENVLEKSQFQRFREEKDDPRAVCPIRGGAREVVMGMIEDVLEVFPDTSHFHLGGDEAFNFGTCPDCRAHAEKHGKASLYLTQLSPLIKYLNSRKIRPILWHDMMAKWNLPELKLLSGQSDLMVWIYDAEWYYNRNPWNPEIGLEEMIARFRKARIKLWGAGAYRCGGDGLSPDLRRRAENMKRWAAAARRMRFKGIVATGWSRPSFSVVPYGPVEAALTSLSLATRIMWEGGYDLAGDIKKINRFCGKWKSAKAEVAISEFTGLVERAGRITGWVNEDRGVREGGVPNLFLLKEYLRNGRDFPQAFMAVEASLMNALCNYAFSEDVRDWVRAYRRITLDKTALFRETAAGVVGPFKDHRVVARKTK